MHAKSRGKGRFTPVHDVLESLMERLGSSGEMEAKDMVFQQWDDIVGEASAHARPFRFRGTVLIVEVAEPAWLTELSMRKRDILSGIERAVGPKVVEDIRFEVKRKRRD
ncbi:MAG: DUF721 domain-containing protein [bacterium]|nr:MAG: DUF721 domain-containing protein [bacterium]